MTPSIRHELGLTEAQAQAALRALCSVVEAGDGPTRRGRAFLDLAAESLEIDATCGAELDEPLTRCLATTFVDPGARRALCEVLVIAACIEGEVSLTAERMVAALARALGVRSPWVTLLPALRRRRVWAVKRALGARSPDGLRVLERTFREEGLLRGALYILSFLLGLHRDPVLSARYRTLESMPEGSFGRQVHEHFTTRGLTYPGEAGGVPERMVHHDLMHVLNEYDTDPAGECELAGFYTGLASVHPMPRGDGFTWIVTVVANFHLGMPVSPAVVKPSRLAFDPARVLAAFANGRRMRVDVMGDWDHWPLLPLPIDEVRRRLGLSVPGRGRSSTLR
jgi:hypothetical protein